MTREGGSAMTPAPRGSSRTPARSTRSAAATAKAPGRATTSAAEQRSTTRASGDRSASASGAAQVSLPVKVGESAWSGEEVAAIRATIDADMRALREEIAAAEAEVAGLMRQSGDGAGDDEADAGSKTLEREHEMSLANNAREMLMQNQRALERLDNGTYGVCENCGQPIGKLRLEAAPRATLCVTCKTKQERR